MKTLVIILLALVAATGSGFTQNLIAVQNGGEPKFYTELDLAITNAQNGDTVYLPGGTFSLTVTIDKRLHIIGVGFNPDSKVTLPTILNGNFSLISGASSGSLTGVRCISAIRFTESITNYTVERVKSPGINFDQNESSYNIFKESIIGYIHNGNNTKYNMYLNNIIEGQIGNLADNGTSEYCTYKNNLFLYRGFHDSNTWYTSTSIINVSNSLFENNIIMGDSILFWNGYVHTFNNSSNTFNNNIFVDNFIPSDSYPCYKNLVKQTPNSIFVNEAGKDYHLQSSSPGKNAGKDGTDIGIYGGAFPWKEGSIPFNPHFQQVQVSPKTDANGNLNVNIKVAAQER